MNPFSYARVTTPPAAVAARTQQPGSYFLAGGTNLVDLLKRGVVVPEKLVDITRLPLTAIEATPTGLRIGALAKNSTVADHELVRRQFPLLSQALNAGASAQLRNMATVGGNMLQRTRCAYFYDTSLPCNKRVPVQAGPDKGQPNGPTGCGALGGYNRMHAIFGADAGVAAPKCIAVHPSDMCVALAALEATVVVVGPKGERRIAFRDFHRLPGDNPRQDTTLGADELITAVEVPANELAAHSTYLKVRDRASYAFALVSVAAGLQLEGTTIRQARLAMGGVAHKPWRLFEAEQFLRGKPATLATFQQAATLAMKGAKGYGENDFKLTLAPNSLVEALTLATTPA
ncbi:xanthine dehydrogenase family protein subunit M [Hymenobacter sp. RP-2-7]|uniref:Xanthine dehydrogenase family protein subunit M n=1 Tax=Hymenobacter polaris TaxID=2682546 RepID=A0A7Y0AEQ2_9BACT|nr:xanthine dehydrogenase family protein subunit M [Hymenobacter polaris]NML65980.1 xanthine dehydrogenase family protein subunit M [Hymenobacter polaris]